MYQDFDSMTDEEVALLAQQGDVDASEYLLNKYKNFVRSKARSYFLVGADHGGTVLIANVVLHDEDGADAPLFTAHYRAQVCKINISTSDDHRLTLRCHIGQQRKKICTGLPSC